MNDVDYSPPNLLPGWSTPSSDSSGVALVKNGDSVNINGVDSTEGVNVAWLEISGTRTQAYIEQTVLGWIVGKVYSLSFVAAVQDGSPRLSVQLDGAEVFCVDNFTSGGGFSPYTFRVVPASVKLVLRFENVLPGGLDGGTVLLDDIRCTDIAGGALLLVFCASPGSLTKI